MESQAILEGVISSGLAESTNPLVFNASIGNGSLPELVDVNIVTGNVLPTSQFQYGETLENGAATNLVVLDFNTTASDNLSAHDINFTLADTVESFMPLSAVHDFEYQYFSNVLAVVREITIFISPNNFQVLSSTADTNIKSDLETFDEGEVELFIDHLPSKKKTTANQGIVTRSRATGKLIIDVVAINKKGKKKNKPNPKVKGKHKKTR